ncbi:hypothetical protein C2E23DRAFT_460993 [Lenzites betulinus]|nr:hypothetical protein C2E23DRAFT_460993 [Lenzites betulinus]
MVLPGVRACVTEDTGGNGKEDAFVCGQPDRRVKRQIFAAVMWPRNTPSPPRPSLMSTLSPMWSRSHTDTRTPHSAHSVRRSTHAKSLPELNLRQHEQLAKSARIHTYARPRASPTEPHPAPPRTHLGALYPPASGSRVLVRLPPPSVAYFSAPVRPEPRGTHGTVVCSKFTLDVVAAVGCGLEFENLRYEHGWQQLAAAGSVHGLCGGQNIAGT